MEELKLAISALDFGATSKLLQELPDAQNALCATDEDGQTLLHLCADALGEVDPVSDEGFNVLKLLLGRRANPCSLNSLGESPLILAARATAGAFAQAAQELGNGRLLPVRHLLEARADPDTADDLTGETALMEAACGGDSALCHLLLEQNADPTRLSAAGKLARDFVPVDDPQRSSFLQLLAPKIQEASSSRPVDKRDPKQLEEAKRSLLSQALDEEQQDSPADVASEFAAKALQACLREAVRNSEVATFERLLRAKDRSGDSISSWGSTLFGLDASGQSLLHFVAGAELPVLTRQVALELLVQEAQSLGDSSRGVDTRNKIGETALMLAVRSALVSGEADQLGACRILLEAQACPDAADKPLGETPLMEAVCAGCHEAVELLLEYRADPLRTTMNNMRASDFIKMACAERQDILRQQLQEGGEHGTTGGLARCEEEKLMPKEKLEVNARQDGLREAAAEEELLGPSAIPEKVGEDPQKDQRSAPGAEDFGEGYKQPTVLSQSPARKWNGKDVEHGTLSALWSAVRAAEPPRARQLLKALENKHAAFVMRDDDGFTLLHLAVMTPPSDRVFATVALLLQFRAQVDARNLLGETPLMLACRAAMERPCDASPAGPWLRPMRKLLEARADPNAADLSGEPPLIEAACYGDLEVCQLLLEGRADAAHESTVGVTALGLAECEGHREVAELLTQHLQSMAKEDSASKAAEAIAQAAAANQLKKEDLCQSEDEQNVDQHVPSSPSARPSEAAAATDRSAPLTVSPPAELGSAEAGPDCCEAAQDQLKKEDLCQSEDEQNVDQQVPSSPSARPSEAAAATDRSEPLTVSPPEERGSAEAGPDCREAAQDQLKKEDLCQSEDEQNVDQHVPSSPSARPSEAAAAADRSEPLTVSESTDLVPAEAGPVLKKEVPRGRPPQVQQDRSMPSQTRSGNTSFTPTLASSPVIKSASSAYSSAQSTQKSTDPSTTRYTGAQPTRLPSRPNTATKTHEPFFVHSRYTSTSKPHAKAKTQAQSQAKRRPPTPESSDGEDQENIGPRIRKAMEPFPSYSGEMPPPEAESTWSDQELYNYFFSSGFIKPKKKASKPKPTPQQMEQYFRTLNLRPGAKAAAVKKAYRQLALRFHPDKNQDSSSLRGHCLSSTME
ncbi:unnamed protein product [Symbiodinium sp. KB8]|nr:unnamed protein product [Symbiodinium sp. KB8]